MGFFYLYDRGVRRIVNVAGIFGAAMIAIATIFTFYEVIARYLLKSPTTWSLDYSIYLIMWGTFFGAGYTLKTAGHINVDIVITKLSSVNEKRIRVGTMIALIVFFVILSWTALKSCIDAYQFHETTLSYTRTPLYVPLMSILLGSFILLLESVRELIEINKKDETV